MEDQKTTEISTFTYFPQAYCTHTQQCLEGCLVSILRFSYRTLLSKGKEKHKADFKSFKKSYRFLMMFSWGRNAALGIYSHFTAKPPEFPTPVSLCLWLLNLLSYENSLLTVFISSPSLFHQNHFFLLPLGLTDLPFFKTWYFRTLLASLKWVPVLRWLGDFS